jgi:hypothetical protein
MKSSEWYRSREERKKKWVGRLNHLSDRIHSIFWVLASVLTIYYSNFFYNIWENEKMNSLFFALSLISFGIFSSLTIYASFLVPSFDDIEVTSPKLIPTATLFGFICFNSTLIAIWPVWGWYSPLMLVTMMMGYLMAGTFMPKGNTGSVLYLIFLVGSFFSSRFIPHQGVLH